MAEVRSVKTAPAELCLDGQLRLAEHAHYVRIDDQVIVADMRTGHYLGLDGVGARVWELIAVGTTRDQAIERLSEEYDVSMDVLIRDIEQLIQELLVRRIVERGGQAVRRA